MSDITRQKTIDYLYYLKTHYPKNLIIPEYIDFAISSLETDEAYQLEYESTTKNDLGVDFKLKDYVSREAVRRIIKSPRSQEQMLNALNSLRNATECKAEDCINRDYTAKYVEEFANNEYVSQDEAETIYLIADGIRHIPSALPNVHDNNIGNIDCISREQALKELKESAEHHANDSREEVLLRRDRDIIRALPSVTLQKPRKGHWIETAEEYYKAINEKGGGINEDTDYFVDDIACSECLAKFSVIDNEAERFDFCPCCGSDNREVVEE